MEFLVINFKLILYLSMVILLIGGDEMKFEQKASMLFSDLNIPEVFITEHLSAANGDYVKIYLYCLFLCKYESEISPLDMSKKLSIPISTVEEALKYWEKNNVLSKRQKSYVLADLKQQEIDKIYKPRVTTSLEDAMANTAKNVARTQAVSAINAMFFQGVMSPTWYTDIDLLFSKYKFDEDVVIALFQYCFDRQALHRNYLFAVAEGWSKNNITNMNELDKYYANFEALMTIKKTVSKKLGLTRKLSQYEEAYVDKWVMDFNYPLNVIEIALKKTTSKTNPSFDYIDKIISDWHERKLSTESEITTFMKDQKQKQKDFKQQTVSNTSVIQKFHNDSEVINTNDFSQFYIN